MTGQGHGARVADLDTYRASRGRRYAAKPAEEPWVKPERVAERHDVSLRTLRRWRKRGLEEFPGAVRWYSRSIVRYRLSAVERWLEETGP